jgi:hypothetical protein
MTIAYLAGCLISIKRLFNKKIPRELDFLNEKRIKDLESNIEQLNFDIKRLMTHFDDAQSDANYWLSIFSLESDISKIRLPRVIPLRAYLSSADPETIERVQESLLDLIDAHHFKVVQEFPARHGSWIKKWFIKSSELLTQKDFTDRMLKIERAIELSKLAAPQASIDERQVETIAKLIKSVENVPEATFQIGSILLIKTTHRSKTQIRVKTLNTQEMINLENNQYRLSSTGIIFGNASSNATLSSGDRVDSQIEEPRLMQPTPITATEPETSSPSLLTNVGSDGR